MLLSKPALRKLTKDEMIALTLVYQEKFNSNLSNISKGLSKLRGDFKKIESEWSVSKNVNSRQCWGK